MSLNRAFTMDFQRRVPEVGVTDHMLISRIRVNEPKLNTVNRGGTRIFIEGGGAGGGSNRGRFMHTG